ncbi:MAG: hypothetical protein KDE09_04620 [Anaerolineales bacterium]|nr:hypothetical protein [Anaerolineales bacterium]
MNRQQIRLVKESFALVEPIQAVAADLFYERLFQLDPWLRPYFRGDMAAQKQKLMTALAFVVAGLDRPDTLLPHIQAMGVRHAGYGVQPEHYDTVGAALLWTLGQRLGEQFTPAVAAAWAAAYDLLASTMRAAAEPAG